MVVKPVAFPAFVQVQHDHVTALGYLRKSMRLLAFNVPRILWSFRCRAVDN
jgi:hypothetical protein